MTDQDQQRSVPCQGRRHLLGHLLTLCVSGHLAAATALAGEPEEPLAGPGVEDLTPDPMPAPDQDEQGEALEDSIDLLFTDFDIVITASRSEQSANMTPVAVSILSADDIRYSGAAELPQLLGFVPGVDALRVDRNRWAIGVRGLHQTFSDRTLFLLNGRNASNPIYGGVDFQTLPIFLDDIRQVEVVRGPGGAAWGANAFNGVINVIDKDPRDTTGVLLSERITEHGDFKTNFRVGAADERFAWRLSGEFNDFDSTDTDNVISGTVVAPSRPNDFLHNEKFGLDTSYSFSDDTKLDIGIGTSHVERGDSPFLGLQLAVDERLDLVNAHAKLSHDFGDGSSGYVQWYGTYYDVNRPSMWRYSAFDQNIDGQYSFSAADDHELTIGGTLRLVNFDIQNARPTDALAGTDSSEQWVGFFIGDRWTISDDWTLESQLRADWYSETMLDWSGRLALLRTLDGGGEHVLRLAVAKAFRAPQAGLRDLSSERLPVGGGLFGINVVPAGDIDNEELYSLEVGYNGHLGEGLTLSADAYLQYYQDLTGVVVLDEPAPVVGRQFFTIDNIGGANAYGFETELRYQQDRASYSVWYAYNKLDYDESNQNARAFNPARNKVGMSARFRASDRLTLNANYLYTDNTPAQFTSGVGAHHRLDLTATMAIPDRGLELQVGILDVFDQTDLLVFDISSPGIAQETPGQTLFFTLHASF